VEKLPTIADCQEIAEKDKVRYRLYQKRRMRRRRRSRREEMLITSDFCSSD
jgi:hypothetical protein